MDIQLPDDLSDANNILLLAPPGAECSDDACCSLLRTGQSGRQRLLSVTVGQSAAKRREFWETNVDSKHLARTTVISMGETGDSSATASADGTESTDQLTVRSIADPTDTLGLGIELTWWLSQWTGQDDRVVCCVYTVSELLDQAGYARTMELLLRLFEWTKRLDATVHYHLNPEAHQDGVIELLRPLFDAVIESSSETLHEGEHRAGEDRMTTQERIAALSGRFRGASGHSLDTVFELLSSRRRREVLYKLQGLESGESLAIAELVDRLVEGEGHERASDPMNERDQITVSLRHRHLPRLADAGVIGDDDDVIVREEWGWLLERWVAQAAFFEE